MDSSSKSVQQQDDDEVPSSLRVGDRSDAQSRLMVVFLHRDVPILSSFLSRCLPFGQCHIPHTILHRLLAIATLYHHAPGNDTCYIQTLPHSC